MGKGQLSLPFHSSLNKPDSNCGSGSYPAFILQEVMDDEQFVLRTTQPRQRIAL